MQLQRRRDVTAQVGLIGTRTVRRMQFSIRTGISAVVEEHFSRNLRATPLVDESARLSGGFQNETTIVSGKSSVARGVPVEICE
jgi:hypothetical protein